MMTRVRAERPQLTYRERDAWINLVTLVLVDLPVLAITWASRPFAQGDLPFVIVALTLTIMFCHLPVYWLLTLLLRLVGERAKKEPTDERDHLLDTRAFRLAYYLLGLLLAVGLVVVTQLTALDPRLDAETRNPINFIFVVVGALLAAEVVRYGRLLIGYRLGK